MNRKILDFYRSFVTSRPFLYAFTAVLPLVTAIVGLIMGLIIGAMAGYGAAVTWHAL